MQPIFRALDAMPVGVCILDEGYTVRFWNRCLELWSGINASDIVGSDVRQRFSDLAAPACALRLSAVLEGGPPAVFSSYLHRHLIPARRPDGTRMLQHVVASGVNLHPDTVWLMLTVQDVTELSLRLKEHVHLRDQALQRLQEKERAEKELIRARDAAEASSRAKSAFLANMSHEIRTPLNGVLGMLGLLMESGLDPKQKELAETASTAGRSLLDIINDVLDFSKIESGKIEVVPSQFRPEELVRNVARSFMPRLQDKGLELEIHLDPELPELVISDASRIRQVLFNILGNAVKFSDRGAVSLFLDWLPRGTGPSSRPRLLFHVHDQGIGMDQDFLSQVFEPFTQAESSYARRFEGTGLGMGIVSRVVRLLGGFLCIESEPGQGTSVYFTVQANEYHAQTPACEDPGPNPQQAQRPGAETKPYKVLLAEDNVINARFLTTVLSRAGHSVRTVETGQAVLEALAQSSFDLVLMDVQMPVMNGEEALKRIRSGRVEHVDSNIPVVIQSAHAQARDREYFISLGADAYLAKPFTAQDVHKCIQGVMERKFSCGLDVKRG